MECLRLVQGTCLLAAVWLLLTALLFSPHSAAAPSHSAAGDAGSGVGAVCVEGALTGAVLSGFAILFYVVVGKVSRSVASMHGFDATVLFSYAMVLWSLSSALSLALSPFMNLYLFLMCSGAMLALSYAALTSNILPALSSIL